MLRRLTIQRDPSFFAAIRPLSAFEYACAQVSFNSAAASARGIHSEEIISLFRKLGRPVSTPQIFIDFDLCTIGLTLVPK